MRLHLATLLLRITSIIALIVFCGTRAFAGQDAQGIIRRLDSLVMIPLAEWKYQATRLAGGERVDLDDSSWPITKVGTLQPLRSTWLRTTVELPESLGGYEVIRGRADLRLWVFGESILYINGSKREQLFDQPVVIRLSEEAKPGERFVIALELLPSSFSDFGIRNAELRIFPPPSRPNVNDLARDLGVVDAFLKADPQLNAAYRAVLDAALARIDFGALDRRDQQQFDASLDSAREALKPLETELKRYSIWLTGQSHIDMAWLWPWTETVEVVRNTFRTALRLMALNPEFTYTQSQAAAYAWIEEKYPALFDEIKQRVKEGRWEIVGGMWVEPDLNMLDGESLVRQILFGKRYFQEKFGVDVRTGWNPDSFGYSWQIPQICKKSGIDFFVTPKMAWNDTTRFPHRLFWWQSPDGSKVLTYFPNDLDGRVEGPLMARHLMDVSAPTGTREIMYLYGVGDHGGGPTQVDIDTAKRLQQTKMFPNLKFGTAQTYLDGLLEKSGELQIPIWDDELYLQYHRGAYTTQAETKRNNRKSEVLLANAEKFSSLAQLFGHPYRQKDLNEAWKMLLFNQFHDILPGSGIAPVYLDAARDFRQVGYIGGDVLDKSLARLAARVKTAGRGMALIVFNPLPWERTEVVEAEGGSTDLTPGFYVADGQGRLTPHQIVGRDDYLNRIKFIFLAEGVPSLGYKTYRVIPGRPAAQPKEAQPASSLSVGQKDLTLENESLRVKVGAESGLIESLYDKVNGREALDQTRQGNLLQTFVDRPKAWDAWNIDADFEDQKWDLTTADSVKVVEVGPVRSIIRVVKHFRNSHFIQDIVLSPKIDRVECPMEVNWQEKHILLKVAFPVSVSSPAATYEIPFGAIRRPTTRETPEDKAKFEVPALRWADLSDQRYGVSILNESKYGYDTKGNVIRLTLLRSPAWPDPHADEGIHRFTYAIYPHKGSWEQSGTCRRANELNYPLLVRVEPNHSGSLPASHSFVALDSPSVFLSAMKKAEDDDSIILRFYRLAGEPGETTITLPKTPVEAIETDLMERNISSLSIEDNRIRIQIRPYEIKTVRVKFE